MYGEIDIGGAARRSGERPSTYQYEYNKISGKNARGTVTEQGRHIELKR